LQKGLLRHRLAWNGSVDAKDAADWKRGVNVLGAINGVKDSDKVAHGKGRVVLNEARMLELQG
jgi:hypothetical protein